MSMRDFRCPWYALFGNESHSLYDKHVRSYWTRVNVLECKSHWSRTMTSSCWVYCWARRSARSLASELLRQNELHWERNHSAGGGGVLNKQLYLPRVNKIEDRQFLGQCGSQSFCIQNYVVMQESCICIQQVHLLYSSLCNTGVTMSHCNFKDRTWE